jgi:hypothetical protein
MIQEAPWLRSRFRRRHQQRMKERVWPSHATTASPGSGNQAATHSIFSPAAGRWGRSCARSTGRPRPSACPRTGRSRCARRSVLSSTPAIRCIFGGAGRVPASTTTPTAPRLARNVTPVRWAARFAKSGRKSGMLSDRRSNRSWPAVHRPGTRTSLFPSPVTADARTSTGHTATARSTTRMRRRGSAACWSSAPKPPPP